MKKIIQNTISKSALIDSIYCIQNITPQYKKSLAFKIHMKTYSRPGRWIYVKRLIFNPEYRVLLDNYQKLYSQFLHWWRLLRIEAIEELFIMIRNSNTVHPKIHIQATRQPFSWKPTSHLPIDLSATYTGAGVSKVNEFEKVHVEGVLWLTNGITDSGHMVTPWTDILKTLPSYKLCMGR